MANAKQDGVHPRTAADIERRYNFGKSFAEVMGIAEDARGVAEEAKNAVGNLDSNLTAEEIFNRLTNNGAIQGLFKGEDGQVYINAKYIKAIEELFANDITMSGKLTYTTEAYLPPSEKEAEVIQNHLVGNITIPDELIPLYDGNGDGAITLSDLANLNLLKAGLISPEQYNGIKKTPVTLTIDLTNPDKAIHIIGTNMWGSKVESYIGLDFGEKLNHYIIEQGEINGWTYRKWNNGDAECWKTVTGLNAAYNDNQSVSPSNAITLPFDVINPVVNVTPLGNLWMLGRDYINRIEGGQIHLVMYTNTSEYNTLTNISVMVSVKGKWK